MNSSLTLCSLSSGTSTSKQLQPKDPDQLWATPISESFWQVVCPFLTLLSVCPQRVSTPWTLLLFQPPWSCLPRYRRDSLSISCLGSFSPTSLHKPWPWSSWIAMNITSTKCPSLPTPPIQSSWQMPIRSLTLSLASSLLEVSIFYLIASLQSTYQTGR